MTVISIHAPSRERLVRSTIDNIILYFNPRSLAGATYLWILTRLVLFYFNPRSLAGATEQRLTLGASLIISIHAPSRERQQVIARRQRAYRHFNPRSLAGATRSPGGGRRWRIISIHAPSRERLDEYLDNQMNNTFQSTLPRGSDPLSDYDIFSTPLISIHAPSRERLYFW